MSCVVEGCETAIPQFDCFCRDHWNRLPPYYKGGIGGAQKNSEQWRQAVIRAREYLQKGADI